VLPELKGKLDGISIRVPTPNVSLVDLKFVAKRATTAQEVNDALVAAAEGKLKGVMTFTRDPLVSSDLNHDPHSCTILLDQTKVIDGNFVNIMGWYDNEWGFSNRMADTTAALAKTL
jgi:glyceraldehyde 3-phosphate dehydrogenase